MIYAGTVIDGKIVLESGQELADGMRVQIHIVESPKCLLENHIRMRTQGYNILIGSAYF